MVNQAVLNSSVEGDRNSGKKNWRAISSAQVHINKGEQTTWKGWSMITTNSFAGYSKVMSATCRPHWNLIIIGKMFFQQKYINTRSYKLQDFIWCLHVLIIPPNTAVWIEILSLCHSLIDRGIENQRRHWQSQRIANHCLPQIIRVSKKKNASQPPSIRLNIHKLLILFLWTWEAMTDANQFPNSQP